VLHIVYISSLDDGVSWFHAYMEDVEDVAHLVIVLHGDALACYYGVFNS
jgi:hypothetical protein